MIDLSPEMRSGFFVDRKRKKLWDIELEMLENLKEICNKHSISWFLIAGSALGAVRHKGFIPWDDDIDLGMLRDDFERFIEIAPKELRNSFVLQYGLENSKEFHYFCRIRDINSTGIIKQEYKSSNSVMGVFIEIYPFDNVPNNKLLRTIQWKLSMAYIEIIRHRIYNTKMGRTATLLSRVFPKNVSKLYSRWYQCCTKYNYKKTALVDTVSIPGYSASEVDLLFREDIESVNSVPFENTYVNIPIGNDRCLKKAYGDYMQLPAENDRGKHHQTEVFYDPFTAYTNYLNSDEVEVFFNGLR